MADNRDLMAQEIDEELRREQLLKLWDQYGLYLLGAALLAILAVWGWKAYENNRIQANQLASTQYLVALQDFATQRPDEAQKALEGLIAKAPAGYAALSRLRLAAHDVVAGNTLDASAAYDQIARDASVDPLLQDYARLQIAMLKFETVTFPELRNQLSPLVNDRNPWRYSARELLGMGAAKAGLTEEARTHFQRLLSDTTTPQGVAERARVMLGMLDDIGREGNAPAADKSAPAAEGSPGSPAKLLPGWDNTKPLPGMGK